MAPSIRLATPVVFLTAIVLAVVASVAAVALIGNQLSYPVMIAVLAILLVSVLIKETVANGDPLTPAGIVAGTGLLLFVLRPLTVANSAKTSPGAIADTRYFSPNLQLAASSALLEVLVFFLAFFLIYYYAAARRPAGLTDGVANGATTGSAAAPAIAAEPTKAARVFLTGHTQALVILTSAIALILLGYLVYSSGGPAAYLNGLANRSEFLSGRAFIGLAYVPVQIALILNILVRRKLGIPAWNWATIAGVCTLVVCAASAGGRGPLIVGVFLPFLILKQIGPKPFRFRSIAFMAAGTAVVAMVYSIIIRESNFDGGRSLEALTDDPIGVLLDRLTSGAETRPFDVLIRLNEVAAAPGFEYQLGATYAAVPAWFVPRALWADKPFGGGNTWFTSTYVPRFYGQNRVETSLSAIGEAFSNFGIVGVVAVGLLLGLFASMFVRSRIERRGIYGAAIAIVLSPYLFSLIRGDAYQGMSTSIGSVVIISVFAFFASRRRDTVERSASELADPAPAISRR